MSGMRKAVRLAVVVSVISSGSLGWAGEAEDALRIAEGLRDFSVRVDELADFEELGGSIPFTALTPTHGLNLDELLTDSLALKLQEALDSGILTSYEALEQVINESDTSVGDVQIDFDSADVRANSDDSSLIDISFEVHAHHEINEALIFGDADAGLDLNGGTFSLALGLNATLNFQLDVGNPQTDEAISLLSAADDPSSIFITIESSAAVELFDDILGFSSISVSGSAMLDIDIGITFIDATSDGLITLDEIKSTAFADLVTVEFLEEPGDEINISLALASDLIPSVEASVTLIDSDLTAGGGGIDDVNVQLGVLTDFTNISPTSVLSGLAELASSMVSLQAFSDVQ